MNTLNAFTGERFYNYTLPGVLLVWLTMVLTVGSWLGR